jgi:hypothetical protein
MRRRQWLRITLLDQQLAKQAYQNLIKKRIVSRSTNKLSGEKIAYICERLVGATGRQNGDGLVREL